MLIRGNATVFAAAGAVGVVFALTPPADARLVHRCSAKYDVAAKSGCGANSGNARRPPPRGSCLASVTW